MNDIVAVVENVLRFWAEEKVELLPGLSQMEIQAFEDVHGVVTPKLLS